MTSSFVWRWNLTNAPSTYVTHEVIFPSHSITGKAWFSPSFTVAHSSTFFEEHLWHSHDRTKKNRISQSPTKILHQKLRAQQTIVRASDHKKYHKYPRKFSVCHATAEKLTFRSQLVKVLTQTDHLKVFDNVCKIAVSICLFNRNHDNGTNKRSGR